MVDLKYEYDVAISFHSLDEQVAVKLNERLRDRFRTFIYLEHQEIIAGTDGERTFADTFGKQARLVVILYRKEWGETPFTRIEKTAIRNRGLRDGYDFTLWVATTPVGGKPDDMSIPDAFIYLDLDRYGTDAAVAVIEQKLRATGGATRPEGAVERAARLFREQRFRDDRETFQKTDVGVRKAAIAFDELSAHLKYLVDEVSESVPLRFVVAGEHRVVGSSGVNMVVAWRAAWANQIDGAKLRVEIWHGLPSGIIPNTYSRSDPVRKKQLSFGYQLVAPGVSAYVAGDGTTLSPEQLADLLLREHLEAISRYQWGVSGFPCLRRA